MKKLLTTAMILGAVITLEATQPAEAVVTQPIVSGTDQSQVTPAYFFWRRHFGPGFVARPWHWHSWNFQRHFRFW